MVAHSTARVDIYEEFYDVINDNITTTDVKISSAFQDDVASFPQVVIHIPRVPRNRQAMGNETKSFDRSGNIDVEVYAETPFTTATLVDDVDNSIILNLAALSVTNISIGDSSEIQLDLGGKIVYGLLLPISFNYSN